MSPEQLSRNGTESGHQKALFAWAAMAMNYGFEAADDMYSYESASVRIATSKPMAALRWLHSIPNGGLRDARTAALMKAEGARRGIPDVFLPVPISFGGNVFIEWKHGLYIEMKKPTDSKIGDEQQAFAEYAKSVGYHHVFAYSWREAAYAIKEYLTHET